MSDAIAKPSKRKGPDPREDAFLRFVNRVMSWTQENARAVAAGGVLAVLLAGAAVWYVTYTQNREQEASTRLRSVETAVADGTAGVQRLESFLAQYEGTDAARQARLLLGRLHLRRGEAEAAIEAVRPAADRPADTPEGYASRMLVAKAQAAAGRREAALGTLETVAEEARFGFQRRQAAARRADILVEMGRLAEAEAVYERITEASADQETEEPYAVRLGEIKAMRAGEGRDGGSSEAAGGAEGPS